MKPALLLACCLAAASPAVAADSTSPETGHEADIGRGAELLSEGAKLLLRGLLDEVEPKMQDLAEALEGWDWQGLGLDDLSQYHAPEVLPNGDIIIRRKTPLVPKGDGPEIEL